MSDRVERGRGISPGRPQDGGMPAWGTSSLIRKILVLNHVYHHGEIEVDRRDVNRGLRIVI